jgi:cytochrome P450
VIPETTRASEPSLAELARLEDPRFYIDPHPVYDRMRREQPVYYYAPLDIFVLTRYADMREAARRPDLFSSAHGVVLSQLQSHRNSTTEIVDQFIDPEGEIFAFTDPPRHRELRKVLMPAFSPRAVTAMSAQIRESCRLLVNTPPTSSAGRMPASCSRPGSRRALSCGRRRRSSPR